MVFCIFDIESSGLTIGSARILEVGCCLYDDDIKEVFEKWSTLVSCVEYGNYDSVEANQAFAVNGINKILLARHGMHPKDAFKIVNRYFDRSDYVIAHAGNNFDRPLLTFEAGQFGITISDKPWIDSKEDIEYGSKFYSRRLQHLAVDVGANSNVCHRALEDCLTLSRVIPHFDMQSAIERSKSPIIRIEGEITFQETDKREEAKKRRFMWDTEKKKWYKLIRQSDFGKEESAVSFKIRRVS